MAGKGANVPIVCMCWGLGASALCVWVLSLAELTPDRCGTRDASLYLVYSEETRWRWCVYMRNSNRSKRVASGAAMKTLN